MKTQGEDVHLQTKERGLRRNQLCQRHLDLRTSNLQNVRKHIPAVRITDFSCLSTTLLYSVMVALANYKALLWPIVDNNTSIYNIPRPCAQ